MLTRHEIFVARTLWCHWFLNMSCLLTGSMVFGVGSASAVRCMRATRAGLALRFPCPTLAILEFYNTNTARKDGSCSY